MTEPTKAVFVSYAREDADAARRIAEALRSQGVEVWFDQEELRGGEAWDAKIKKQIRECALFLAVISGTTQARGEGYFRREWKMAVERTSDMAAGVAFLVPVAIDETPGPEALVPDEFMRVQWTRLPGALPTPDFVAQVKNLLSGGVRRRPTLPPMTHSETASPMRTRPPMTALPPLAPKPPPGPVAAPAKKPRRVWPLVLLAVLVAGGGAGGYFFMREFEPVAPPPAPTKAPPTQPATKPAVTAPAPVKEDKSIAVIPFENRSTDKEANAIFTDGIHEDILTNLAHIREFRVVSRTSVEQYRKTTKSIPQIAKELGVTYILEGSVQRDGNKVRVTGQLIHAATDEHVWAENYTRDLTDVFAIQSELAKAIADELKTTLSAQEKSLLERRPTENAAAYDLWVKARDLGYSQPAFTQPVAQQLESLLQAAVDLDPKFAAAWGYLADTHARYYFVGYDRSAARLAKAKAAIERAVALEPDSPGVIFCLGVYCYQSQRDYVRATEQFEKLLRLQPNDASAWGYLGIVQRSQGRWQESLTSTRKAVQLDPASISYARNLLSSLRYVRRFDEALTVMRRLAAMDPLPRNQLGTFLQTEASATGSTREAEAWIQRVFSAEDVADLQKSLALFRGDFAEAIRLDKLRPAVDPAVVAALGANRVQALMMAEVYQAAGDQAGARARLADQPALVRKRLETEPTNTQLWQALSRMESILGHKEEALRCAQKAVEFPEAKDGFDGPPAWSNLAVIHAWTGDKDRALAELAEILRKPSYLSVNAMKGQPAYYVFRDDPRFEALLNDPKNNQPLF